MATELTSLEPGKEYFVNDLSGSLIYKGASSVNERSLGYISTGYISDNGHFIVVDTVNIKNNEYIKYEGLEGKYSLRITIDYWLIDSCSVSLYEASELGVSNFKSGAIDWGIIAGGEGKIRVGNNKALFVADESEKWKVFVAYNAPSGDWTLELNVGVGRAFFGLTKHDWPSAWQDIDYAWYVHSSTEIRVFEIQNRIIRSVKGFTWSAIETLGIRKAGTSLEFMTKRREQDDWEVQVIFNNFNSTGYYVCGSMGPNCFIGKSYIY